MSKKKVLKLAMIGFTDEEDESSTDEEELFGEGPGL